MQIREMSVDSSVVIFIIVMIYAWKRRKVSMARVSTVRDKRASCRHTKKTPRMRLCAHACVCVCVFPLYGEIYCDARTRFRIIIAIPCVTRGLDLSVNFPRGQVRSRVLGSALRSDIVSFSLSRHRGSPPRTRRKFSAITARESYLAIAPRVKRATRTGSGS